MKIEFSKDSGSLYKQGQDHSQYLDSIYKLTSGISQSLKTFFSQKGTVGENSAAAAHLSSFSDKFVVFDPPFSHV